MKEKVQWSVGDEIVIAGTSWQKSKTSREETAIIQSISDNGKLDMVSNASVHS